MYNKQHYYGLIFTTVKFLKIIFIMNLNITSINKFSWNVFNNLIISKTSYFILGNIDEIITKLFIKISSDVAN